MTIIDGNKHTKYIRALNVYAFFKVCSRGLNYYSSNKGRNNILTVTVFQDIKRNKNFSVT